MVKQRKTGKLGALLGGTPQDKTPSNTDIQKMLEETEAGKVPQSIRNKKKISTEVDAQLYEQFRSIVKRRGLKLGFVLESFIRQFVQDNS